MKKVLSLVLVIAMILSSFSFAFAAKFEDVEGDYEEAIDTLVALGVITGYEDGTFRPNQVVTRAEMAKLIVEILGYGDLVSGAKSNFADTQGHWADPWIAIASGRGLVLGDGDGNFRPNDPVSYDEAITMIIRALGYTDDCNELKGMTWPTNFKVKASELDLLDGLKSLAGGADRGGIAQLLFNALEAILVTIDSDGNVVYVKDNKEDKPLLSRLAEKVTFTVNANHVDPDHKDYKGDVVDLYQYMYQNITVYEKDDVVVFVKGVNSLTFTGTVKAVTSGSITIEDENEDEFTFKTSDVDDFMYNYEGVSAYDHSVLEADEAKVTVVLEGEDGDKIKDDLNVLAVVATKASGYVLVEDPYVDGELTLDVIYLPKDGKVVDFDNLTIKGDAESLEDIEEDDVLAVFVPLKSGDDSYFDSKAADKMTIIVARETVEGKITKKTGSDYYIDGVAYEANPYGDAIAVGDEGVFFLDYNGKIFAFESDEEATPGNYALVLDKTNGYQTTSGGVVLAEPKVKLLTASGDEITYVIDKKAYDDVYAADKKVVTENGRDLNVNLVVGDIIEYKLNSDKEINKILFVDKANDRGFNPVKTNAKSFKLAKNAVIFNVPGGNDYEDAVVVTKDDLDPKEITAYKIMDVTEIVVLLVSEGIEGETGTFALITKNDGVAYDEDEEVNVTLYTAYVDGKKVEYLAHTDAVKDPFDVDFKVKELKLTNGKLKNLENVTDVTTGTAINQRITDSISVEGVEKPVFLADDVVVYVLKYDDNGKLTFDKVGVKNDIRGRYFEAYDVYDDDGDYDIIVVYPEEYDPEEYLAY
ncbi:MAG TPA: S-layer homology domain-containing protein [Sedimentibacter sp.]|nr:S-layer homology domain-containing protein [Sedimentibacter sp.]